MTPEAYVDMVLSELATSGVIASFEVAERWTSFDRGYIRVRARHVNGDFLELAEYFVLEDETPVTQRYRYQWMDEHRQVLRRRWDNVEHFPDLPGFPHHVHLADGRVTPASPLSILELLPVIAAEP